MHGQSLVAFVEQHLGSALFQYQRRLLEMLERSVSERRNVIMQWPLRHGRASVVRFMKEWMAANGVDSHATVNITGGSDGNQR